VLARGGAVVGVDVRGLAPGTRETDLCRPGTLVERAHAVLLSGGSAFGLDAASGVTRFLSERDIGFDTGVAKVPIVPAAVLFDLGLGRPAWPDAAMGHRACELASPGAVAEGCVGAGTGATVGKLLGPSQATKSGIGTASATVGGTTVGAIVAVNALGDVLDPSTGAVVAGARDPTTGRFLQASGVLQALEAARPSRTNTTIGVVATDASLNADAVNHLASIAHDGLARTIRPVHTLFDGDAIFALATGAGPPETGVALLRLAAATIEVVERAIVRAARAATPAGGLPAAGNL
ncbi:MAG: P1 family peptidase, partial [Chloroflexi bacterium]|nr:P1 family peptidase [Chloroflexota bacterium]